MRKQDTPSAPSAPPADAPASEAAAASKDAPGRERSRAARFIRHFGEDAVWAMQGWTGVPKPVLRFGTCCVGGLASWWFNIDGVAESIMKMIGG